MAEARQMKDLSLAELDRHIDALTEPLASPNPHIRTNAEYAVLALLRQRNRIAPAQLPAVPEGLVARQLGEGPVPVTELTRPIGGAALLELLALEQAVAYEQPATAADAQQPVAAVSQGARWF